MKQQPDKRRQDDGPQAGRLRDDAAPVTGDQKRLPNRQLTSANLVNSIAKGVAYCTPTFAVTKADDQRPTNTSGRKKPDTASVSRPS